MKLYFGRAAGRKTASTLFLAALLTTAFALSACGVKNDLQKPDGTTTPKTAPDPSKPPFELGR
jgi:predicted small lipoprotein YifL